MSPETEPPAIPPARRLPPAVWVPLLIAAVGGLLYVFSALQG